MMLAPGKLSGRYCNFEHILVVPNFDQVVTPTGHESSLLARARVGADQATRESRGSPANRVHAHSMGMEGLVGPVVVTELEDTN